MTCLLTSFRESCTFSNCSCYSFFLAIHFLFSSLFQLVLSYNFNISFIFLTRLEFLFSQLISIFHLVTISFLKRGLQSFIHMESALLEQVWNRQVLGAFYHIGFRIFAKATMLKRCSCHRTWKTIWLVHYFTLLVI